MASLRIIRQLLGPTLSSCRPAAFFCTLKPYIRVFRVSYSTQRVPVKSAQQDSHDQIQIRTSETIKGNAKSFGNFFLVVGGIGLAIYLLFVVLKEIFGVKSTQGVYNLALERCLKDTRVRDILGEPIKSYGEESRMGHRSHINHKVISKHGTVHVRIQFNIQGNRNKAVVHVEVIENNETGNFDFLYLIVQVQNSQQTVIVLEDRRMKFPSEYS